MNNLLISDKKIFQFILFISLVYLIPYTIDFIYLLNFHVYLADLSYYKITTKLDNITLWFLYIRGLLYYVFGILLFIILQKKSYHTNFKIVFLRKKFEILLILFLGLQIFFAMKFYIGAAGGHRGNKFSTIMNLINVEALFPIYYFLYREKTTKTYFLIIIIYCILKGVQGWSGFILSIFFMEVLYKIYKGKLDYKIILLIPIVILLGGLAYKLYYPVKIFFRTGSSETISYIEGLVKLVTRLSCFSNSCAAFEYQANMFHYNSIYSYEHAEIVYFFNAITPSFFYNKNFKPLNQILLVAVFNGYAGFSNFDLGATYYYLLFRLCVFDFIVYFSIIIISSVIYRFLLEFISPASESLVSIQGICTCYYLTFLIGGGLNTQLNWLFMILPLFFCFFGGAIKIKRNYRGK